MNTIAALKKTKQQLHDSGFKLTPQREATVLVLLENEKEHLSAEEIYFFVKKKSPEIGLATVYRTLEILTELNVVNKVSFNDGVARYDLRKEGAKHFHHHLLCLECGNIEEIEEDLLGEVEEVVEQRYQFQVKDHRLTFHGICHQCQEKMKQNQ
ncbi:ferric iron uptake transcriptional regulator [Enterococcus camelliae]|jgi:Fur family ferric uptake transcriptional regulator|uniref:Fur family transcriptional regulator n=1 Tax=Enterococcus camelliae TaxID=453959 RepID=A0ABW5TMY5_9ENTE